MDTTAAHQKFTPPYIAWLTLLHLLERMESEGVPPQVDRSYLTGSNTSNAQLMNALKSLGLTDDSGKVTDSLRELAENPNDRKRLVAQLLSQYYPEPVRLGTNNATQQQLERAFAEEYEVTGSTLRKAISFFLQAAEYAQIQRSRYWKKPTQRQPAARRPRSNSRPAASVAQAGTAAIPAATVHIQHDDKLHPSLQAMVSDLRKHSNGWTQDQRDSWVTTFETLLDYAIPITNAEAEE